MTTFLVCLHSPYINGTFHPQPVQNGIRVLVVTTIAMIATQFGYENQIEIYLLIFQCMIYSTQVCSWWRHGDVTNIRIFIRQCCPGKITNKQEFHCIISPLYGYHSAFWYCTGKNIWVSRIRVTKSKFQSGKIEVNVIELDFDFESFLDYYVIHDSHYFVFEEVSGKDPP